MGDAAEAALISVPARSLSVTISSAAAIAAPAFAALSRAGRAAWRAEDALAEPCAADQPPAPTGRQNIDHDGGDAKAI